ncbi:MAG: hypothetical protein JXA97_12445 [Anaerolineales bacterium]|nr:hypothetical protein [Anaerolineales bacterium]
MSFLGIGPLELLFVVLIAVILVGPRDLGKGARSAGRLLNRIYRSDTWKALTQMSGSIRDLPAKLAREAEVEELDELRRTAGDVRNVLKGNLDGLKSELRELDDTIEPNLSVKVEPSHPTEDAPASGANE